MSRRDPEGHVERMERALDQSDFMIPASSSDVSQLAVVEALRAQGDAMRRQSELLAKMSDRFDDIGESIHTIDKRLVVIENNSLERDVKSNRESIAALDGRIDTLESAVIRNGEERMQKVEQDFYVREGMGQALRMAKDYGPMALVVLTGIMVLLIVTGRVHV